jgi:hypothetical protein
MREMRGAIAAGRFAEWKDDLHKQQQKETT